ncbi:MAG: 1-phosphofructokinase family hexose kinase [Pseudomonadota bacterium]
MIRTLTLSPALDIGADIARMRPFSKLRSGPARHEPGGGGINAARAIHRVGGEVCAVFPADAATGERLLTLLAGEDVPAVRVPADTPVRESLSLWVREQQETYHVVTPGGDLDPVAAQACVGALLESSAPVEWVVLSGSLPPGVETDYYGRVARAAGERGVRVVLDTHGEALVAALRSPVFAIKPNLREFGELVGERLVAEDRAGIERAARTLMARAPLEVLLLTLGPHGAMVTTSDRCHWLRAPTVRTVSAVGCGDSFLGVFTQAVASGRTPVDAARLGIAAGASAACTPGSALFVADDLERLEGEALTEPRVPT